MNGFDEVHQIECRWLPRHDLSPIASSFPAGSDAVDWFARLKPAIRPKSGADAPDETMVYLTLADGSAAVICRQWNLDAVPLQDSSVRRPIVARILIGSQQLLSPQVAMSLCLTGLRDVAGIPPGQVGLDTHLPPVSGSRLADLADSAGHSLDEGGREQPGLGRLITAAVRDHCTPLAVQLPGHEMRERASSPQAFLLWGLWRTTRPLLAGISDLSADPRGWSFSTYEPPLDASDTTWLPGIVFRAQQPRHQPAQVLRPETTVAPRDPPGLAAQDGLDALGIALARAYAALGAQELSVRLAAASAYSRTLSDRLATVSHALAEFMPPARAARIAPAAREAPHTDARSPGEPALTPLPEPTTADSPGAPSEWTPVPTDAAPHTPLAEPIPLAEPSRAAEPSRETPPERGGHARQPGPGEQDLVSQVLGWLGRHPDAQRFPAALRQLSAGPPPPPEARATARDAMPGHEWYIPVLAAFDPRRVEETLVAIFRQIVIPDLGESRVRAEMGVWASEYNAPTTVIRALIAAADRAGDVHSSGLEDVLKPALYRRWLTDHAVYAGPIAHGASMPRSTSAPARRFWKFFPAGERTAVAASLLAWLCLLLAMSLAASLLL